MMKKIVFVSLLLLIAISTSLYFYNGGDFLKKILGSKGISEGVIEYDITFPKLDPNNMLSTGMPTKAYLRFKDDNTSNDMSGMMGLFILTYISKPKENEVYQTLDFIGKKYVAQISASELKQLNDSYVVDVNAGNNTTVVAGFKCKEAVVKLSNGETTRVYYTNDINIKKPNWSNPYSKIEGVLMDFQIERYGIIMHLRAKQVLQQKVDDSSFEIPSENKKIPFSELEGILKELNP